MLPGQKNLFLSSHLWLYCVFFNCQQIPFNSILWTLALYWTLWLVLTQTRIHDPAAVNTTGLF